jgi:hypothetical protein
MSLVSDRVGYLLTRYTAQDIAEITGISLSSISPSVGVLEPLDGNVRKNIYNLYGRTVYADLRAVGASASEARGYRSKSVASVIARLGQRTELIDDLANGRLAQYTKYLQRQGRYVSEEDTLASLKESIATAMGRSKLAPSHYDYESYPTLDYGVLDDED